MEAATLSETRMPKRLAYLALTAFIYLASGMNAYRLIPIMTRVSGVLGIGEGLAGILISVNTFMSLLLSIPFGILLRRMGFRRAGLLAGALMLAGSFVGTTASTFPVMMLSQFLTGIGGALVMVIFPNLTFALFEKRHRSTALGVTTSAQLIAQFLMYNIAPRITTDQNISPAWWLTCFTSLALLILWGIFIRPKIAPVDVSGHADTKDTLIKDRKSQPGIRIVLCDRRLVLLMLGIFFYMLSALSVLSFLPSYLQNVRGMDIVTASALCSVNAMVAFVAAPLYGLLADKLHTRKWIYCGLVLIMAVVRILQVTVPNGPLYPIIIFAQGLPGAGLPLVMGAASELYPDERQRTLAVSMISTGSMGGVAMSTAIFGGIVQNVGYDASILLMAPVALLGLIGMMTSKDIR